MKLFESQKKLESLLAQFATAGIEAEALIAAGPDALKAEFEQREKNAAEAALANLGSELGAGTESLSEFIAGLKQSAADAQAKLAVFTAGLAQAGVHVADPDNPEDIASAIRTRASVKAAQQLAGNGCAPVSQDVTPDATNPAAPKQELKGLERTIAAFMAERRN